MNLRVLLGAVTVAAFSSGGVSASCVDLDVAETEGLTISHAYDLVSLCLPDPRDARFKYTWVSSDNLKVELVPHPDFDYHDRYIHVAVKPVSSAFQSSRVGRIEFHAFSRGGIGKGELNHYSIDVRFPPESTSPVTKESLALESSAASGACMAPADFRVSAEPPRSSETKSLIHPGLMPELPALWEPPVSNTRVRLGSTTAPALWAPQDEAESTPSDRVETHPRALWSPDRELGQSQTLWSPAVASRAQMITELFEASNAHNALPETTPALWLP